MKENHIEEIDDIINQYEIKAENYKTLKELWVDNQELHEYYRVIESKTRSDLRKLVNTKAELLS